MIRHIVGASIGFFSAAQASPDNTRDWFTLSIDGVRTGYAFEERRVDHDVVIEHASTTITIRELGRRARIAYDATLRSDATGRPIAFDYRQEVGTDREEWHGEFADSQLVIHQRDGTRQKTTRVDVPRDGTLSPLREPRLAAHLVFDPQRKTFVATDEYAGSDSRLFGRSMTRTACQRDCDARIAEPMDAIASLLVRSPVRIPDWYRHRSIRYVISRADGRAPDAIETFEQDVLRDGERAVLTICEDCGHESGATPTDIAYFLRPNAWVRSDDAQIRQIALGAVGGANVHESMRSLTKFVMLAMRGSNDFIGYADAVTALKTGSGDCTEFAVLLAAVARARGIPTRIVVGVAYSSRFSGRKDVFSPHMWVQAWDGGRWTSYDAALDGFDSTHIALAIGDGDPAAVSSAFAALSMLRIEKAGVLRAP